MLYLIFSPFDDFRLVETDWASLEGIHYPRRHCYQDVKC